MNHHVTAFITMPGGIEWLLILLVALLVFGKNLPKVMRDLGKSVRTFKQGMGLLEEQAPPKDPFSAMASQPLSRSTPVDQELDNLLEPQRPADQSGEAADDLESDPPPTAEDLAEIAASAEVGLHEGARPTTPSPQDVGLHEGQRPAASLPSQPSPDQEDTHARS